AKPKVAVRLVDGKTPNEGRVEVRYKGTWGTICNDAYWDIRDAYVICHMLNYSKAVTATTTSVKGTGPIWLKRLYCTGSQESIDQCWHYGWGKTGGCDHSRDAGVVCGNAINVNVRLVDGKTTNEGRVEVRYKGTWGTICNDIHWGIWDAYVVCHMLNYSKAVTATTASVKGTGPIWLKGLRCLGYEETVDQCRHGGWGSTSGCDHSRDAGVVCGNLTPEEKTIKVRLVGDQNHTGKVEIQYQGIWGVVCDYWWYRWWDIRDAHVICRMLGYKASKHAIRYIEGGTPRRGLMYDVGCRGREKSIAECAHSGWWKVPSRCSNKLLVGVVCKTNECKKDKSLLYHGQWGTVCNVGWDMKDAEVVCRMLGYPGVQEYKTTDFTPVKGIIWLQYVGCTGRETSIADCSHNGWGNTDCYHSRDVGLTCKMGAVRRTTQAPTTTKPLLTKPLTSSVTERPTTNKKQAPTTTKPLLTKPLTSSVTERPTTNKKQRTGEPGCGNFTPKANCSKEDDGKKSIYKTCT
ncbi:deleted in malignant brain tumors 1 protein-like, partial [Actinia tenebrosa]|uniref:Deleted in malignant brain tumors 1 protein-like n=1 Tax=Actinia tenebrosa TaxID=6105 RepID=A0A6P8HVX7_ACTTE